MAASNRPKQLPQHRKHVARPFIGNVAARRAKNREHFTAVETAAWLPPPLISESPLFPTANISKHRMSVQSRPKLLQIQSRDMFSSHLINEMDTEDEGWAKSGRNPAADPRWWTAGVVRAVSRIELAHYFNQQEVMARFSVCLRVLFTGSFKCQTNG